MAHVREGRGEGDIKLVVHWSSAGPSCPGRHGSLSSKRESHPVPGGFPPNVVLQCGDEVSHCGQTEADIRVDSESGNLGAAMIKVSSS